MLREFFYYHKSDRKVIVFFLTILIIATALIYGVSDDNSSTPLPEKDKTETLKTPISSRENKSASDWCYAASGRRAELFPFDPNVADASQLLRLGLQPWQVRNICKYRAMGGVYRKPSDFARLYGLTKKQYKALESYIRIRTDDYRPASEMFAVEHSSVRDTAKYPVKLRSQERMSLNIADTTSLRKVPGVGYYYARRIVAYRERLGGYCDVNQLKEIEGFPESALKYFVISGERIKKLNVNKLTLSQLRRHPYINFFQAKAITDYRRLKGPVKSLEELRLMKEFPAEEIKRLSPYVSF